MEEVRWGGEVDFGLEVRKKRDGTGREWLTKNYAPLS